MCCGKFYPDNNHPGAWIYPAWSWSLTGNISLLWDLFLTLLAVKFDLKWPWPPAFTVGSECAQCRTALRNGTHNG